MPDAADRRADRPGRGPLPGRRPRPVRRRQRRRRWPSAGSAPATRRSRSTPTERPRSTSIYRASGLAGDRGQRRQDRQDRPQRQARTFVELQDQTGNIYTYAHLGSISRRTRCPSRLQTSPAQLAKNLIVPVLPAPTQAASAGAQRAGRAGLDARRAQTSTPAPAVHVPGVPRPRPAPQTAASTARPAPPAARAHRRLRRALRRPAVSRSRSGCSPTRPGRPPTPPAASSSFARRRSADLELPATTSPTCCTWPRTSTRSRRCEAGVDRVAGTILGRIGPGQRRRLPAHGVHDPAGRQGRPDDRPQADPRRLEAARGDRGVPRRRHRSVLRPRRQEPDRRPDPADEQGAAPAPRSCRTRTCRSTPAAAATSRPAQIDRRILAAIEFLSASGLDPTISGTHSAATGRANRRRRRHRRSNITRINNIPIAGHQGTGSVTDLAIRRLLTLQGALSPTRSSAR